MPEFDLKSVAFPTLSPEQITGLSKCTDATLKHFSDGQELFAVGDPQPPVFVVKSGEIAIVDYTGDEPRTITTHKPGGFTGDISHVTGDPALACGIARGDCEAYEIPRPALRSVLDRCPGLSDTILQAFIARRQLLRESSAFTGLRLIGSRYSADTFRIREFLARNRVLFKWLDLESDPDVDRLLRQFGLTEQDTPVV